MAKPILIVRLDKRLLLNTEPTELGEHIQDKFNKEYHVFVIPLLDNYNIEMEVLNVRDINEIDVEELKKKVKEDIEKLCRQ